MRERERREGGLELNALNPPPSFGLPQSADRPYYESVAGNASVAPGVVLCTLESVCV